MYNNAFHFISVVIRIALEDYAEATKESDGAVQCGDDHGPKSIFISI
jgi:hypothetical protein